MAAVSSTMLGKTSRINVSQTNLIEQERQSLVEEDYSPPISEHPLAWKIFNDEEVDKLKNLTPPELERMFANMLDLKDYKVSLADGAKLDYFVGGFLFASEEKYNKFQISCIMGLLNKVLMNCESKMTLKKNVEEFIGYFTGIKNDGLPKVSGMEQFTAEQAKKVMDFINQGIFQHYKLYQNLFLDKQEEERKEKTLEIEVPPIGDLPFPAPLHEGMPLELYEKYIAPPPPQLEEAEQVGESNEKKEDAVENTNAQGEEGVSVRHLSEKESSAAMILKNLKPEEIKQIVTQMTQETLQAVKADADQKIKDKESVIVSKLNKLHLT